ncbi:MAG: hypothetical protein ACRDLD_09935, partial [Thermoleophilaceae bacterium]
MNAEPRQGQVPVGPLVAAVGAVLLVVSLFLDWYEQVSGFTVFELVDMLLVLLAVGSMVALAAEFRLLRRPLAAGLSVGLGALAFFVVVFQLLNDPPAVAGVDGPDQDLGIWLALAGAAVMVAGAVLGNARISLAVETRAREPGAPRSAADPGAPSSGAEPG